MVGEPAGRLVGPGIRFVIGAASHAGRAWFIDLPPIDAATFSVHPPFQFAGIV